MVERQRVVVQVAHLPDRTFSLRLTRPGPAVEIGEVARTTQLTQSARDGVERLLGLDEGAYDLDLQVPRPAYAVSGRLVRVRVRVRTGDDGDGDGEDVDRLGEVCDYIQAGVGVDVDQSGCGLYPAELLDWDPVVTQTELEQAWSRHAARWSAQERGELFRNHPQLAVNSAPAPHPWPLLFTGRVVPG